MTLFDVLDVPVVPRLLQALVVRSFLGNPEGETEWLHIMENETKTQHLEFMASEIKLIKVLIQSWKLIS